jgi:hypothetical protein
MSLLVCENREEYLDFSVFLKRNNDLVVLDLLDFYSEKNESITGFNIEVLKYKNPFSKKYGQLGVLGKISMNFYISVLVFFTYYRHSNGGDLYTGISLFAFRFARIFMCRCRHISYIRSVFMPRSKQLWYVQLLKTLPIVRRLAPFYADQYWVLGNATKAALNDLGVGSENVKGFKPPHLAFTSPSVATCSYDSHRIVFVMGAHDWHGDSAAAIFERNTIQRLKEVCEERNIELILRPHPRGVSPSDLTSIGHSISDSTPEQFLYNELSMGSLLISNFSMMGMEYDYIGGNSIYVIDDSTAQYLSDWISVTGASYYSSVDDVFNAFDRRALKYLSSENVYFNSSAPEVSESSSI